MNRIARRTLFCMAVLAVLVVVAVVWKVSH